MKITLAAAAFALALVAAVSSRAGEWRGRVVETDGARHVVNPAGPVEPDVVRDTREAWRLGGDEDDIVFGSIDDVAVAPDGTTFLLDSQVSTVYVVSPDGALLRSIGSEGEGPAEFRMASNVMLIDGGNVCVLQVMPARAVVMTPEGHAVGDHPLPRGKDGSHAYLNGGTSVKGRLVLDLASLVEKETSFGLESSWVLVDSEGGIVTTFYHIYQHQDLAKVTFDEKADAPAVWAAGDDGRFYINNGYDDYAVDVVDSDGSPAFVIEREYEPVPKDARDLARNDSLVAEGTLPAGMSFAQTQRAVLDLLPRPGGSLWVLNGRGPRAVGDDMLARFDEFDADGHFVRRVTIAGACVFGRDEFHVAGDRVYVVTNVGDFAGDFEPAGGTGDITVTCLVMNGAR